MVHQRVERLNAREAQRDIADAMRRETFHEGHLVKVLPLEGDTPNQVIGYITFERCLFGKTPAEIGKALGVKDKFDRGCRVVRLQRAPFISEASYELTTAYPDGVAPGLLSSEMYPPADVRHVHQWRLKKPIVAGESVDVRADMQFFPRDKPR